MATKFNEAGIPAVAVTSASTSFERQSSLQKLRAREINVVFTVDLFNEGVDIPEIDTVLFLRPTESATIFLQQLGRGLRLADDKPCLTVLDFLGHQHQAFRFDLRYRSLTGITRRMLAREVENGFPTLPAGCHLSLDRVAGDIVLRNESTGKDLPKNSEESATAPSTISSTKPASKSTISTAPGEADGPNSNEPPDSIPDPLETTTKSSTALSGGCSTLTILNASTS